MHMVRGFKAVSFGAAALVLTALSACNSNQQSAELAASGDSLAAPPASVTTKAKPMEGLEAPYCPAVSLREGTAILKKEIAGKIDYVASITEATRDCRIVDGKLHMEVGLVGRVTAGPVAQDRVLKLPIRIAILKNGKDVVYSQLGYQAAVVNKATGAQSFVFVDRSISIDQTSKRNLTVYVGFDETGGR